MDFQKQKEIALQLHMSIINNRKNLVQNISSITNSKSSTDCIFIVQSLNFSTLRALIKNLSQEFYSHDCSLSRQLLKAYQGYKCNLPSFLILSHLKFHKIT